MLAKVISIIIIKSVSKRFLLKLSKLLEEQQLKKIAYLKATFKNSSKITKDTNDVAEVNAFDKELNKLNVSINPNEVNLKVSVAPFNKR